MKTQLGTVEGSSPVHRPEFAIWAVLGVVFGVSSLVFPTAGLGLIVIAAVIAATRPAFRRSWFGAFMGVGGVLLYVAFAQRHGPGTVCWQTATASGCDEYLNPWPWFAAGTTFVVAGLAAQIRHTRAIAGQPSTPSLSG